MKKLCWICLLLLMSCELIVDVDVPYSGDKIVVNAIQSPDGPWTIELTKTKYILDSGTRFDFPPIAGAEVTLFEPDGSSYRLPGAANGVYWNDRYPEEGKTYRLVAKAEGYKDVEAEMTVPKAVKIIDVKWDSSGIKKIDPDAPFYEQYYSHANIPYTITFSDPANEKNYYILYVYYWYVYTFVDPQTQQSHTDTLRGSTGTWITDPALSREEDRKSRFSDFAINGATYTLAADANFFFTPTSKVYKFDVVLASVSEEFFEYEESRALFNQVEGDPFAQPVQIYSNVGNGLGIFAGFATDVKSYQRKYPD